MSSFGHDSATRRYALARPFFHPLIQARIIRRIIASEPLDRAIEPACGIGQSSMILPEMAKQVIGISRSAKMLAVASAAPGINYAQATGESLPIAASTFDLVTVGLQCHWFDQESFQDDAARVLRPGS